VVMDHRHAQTMGAGRQPPFTGLSTCGRDGQRSRGTRGPRPRAIPLIEASRPVARPVHEHGPIGVNIR
jgi:hypothetical protein